MPPPPSGLMRSGARRIVAPSPLQPLPPGHMPRGPPPNFTPLVRRSAVGEAVPQPGSNPKRPEAGISRLGSSQTVRDGSDDAPRSRRHRERRGQFVRAVNALLNRSRAREDLASQRETAGALNVLLRTFEDAVEELTELGKACEEWSVRDADTSRIVQEVSGQCEFLRRSHCALEYEKVKWDQDRESLLSERRRLQSCLEVQERGRVATKEASTSTEIETEPEQTNEKEEEKAQASTAKEASVQDKSKQLQALVKELELTKEKLTQSLEKKTTEVEDAKSCLSRDVDQMKEEHERKLLELQNENDSLRRLVQENSSGGAGADRSEPSRSGGLSFQSSIVSQSEQARSEESTKLLADARDREEELHRALSMKEREAAQLHESVRQHQMHNEQLRGLAQTKSDELERAVRDIAALTREGQAVATETARLGADLASTKERLENEIRRADKADHDARASNLEKNDLMANYRAVTDERSHLERTAEDLSRERARLNHELELTREECNRLQGQLGDMEEELQRRSADAAGFDRELDRISRDGLATRRALEALEVENRRLKEDLVASREGAGMAARRFTDLQRNAAAATHEADALRGTAAGLRDEVDALQRVLSEERRRADGLESLLSSARAKDAAAASQIRNLARENAELSTKLNEAHARLGDASPSRTVVMSVSPRARHEHGASNLPASVSFSPSSRKEAGGSREEISPKKGDEQQPRLIDYLNLQG